MSAPKSTHSKERPSLLAQTPSDGADSSSRILASLEGRVVAQQPARGRSKKSWVGAGLAVIVFGGLGAWQWQRVQREHSVVVAIADKPRDAVPASGASAPRGQSTQSEEPSVPQAAVIVADDHVHANSSVSMPDRADPLSRALATDAAPAPAADKISSATTVTAASSAASSAASAARHAPVARTTASRNERETSKSRRGDKVAAAHPGKHATKARAPAVKEDSDADLLAVLIARTKPYTADTPKSASAPTARKAEPSAKTHTASLGDQVKACDKGSFFEAQLCRWRVCSDHWGKDSACPSPASSTASSGQAR